MRLLLDTDIGDNIDDAYALALALADPDIEIVGVTTVWGDTAARARMVRHMLDLFRHGDVPVYTGVGKAILGVTQTATSSAQLAMTPDTIAASTVHAVDAIRNTYANSGSDVVLVTIGPLTNLALALAIDPALAERIPRVYAMGGNLARAEPETNMRADPVAAAIVLRSGVPLTLVPKNITEHARITPDHLVALAAAPGGAIGWLMDLTRAWHAETNRLPVLHDPLTLAIAANDARFETTRCAVEIDLASGITTIVPNGEPTIDVVTGADGPAFVAWLTELLVHAQAST